MENSPKPASLTRTPQPTTEDIKTQQKGSGELVRPTEVTTLSEETKHTPEERVGLGLPPLVSDLLEVGEAYNTFDVKDQLREIDEYIREEGGDYEKVLEELLKNIKETDNVYTKVEEIRDYVRLQQKIKAVIREKKEFEQMDPKDMSAKQLERYFKENDLRRY